MIKSEFVEVGWSHRSKKYYQDKGYVFTSYGDIFIADVNDLSIGCNSEVIVKCDYCSQEFKTTYHKYNNYNKKYIDKDACENCKFIKSNEASRSKLRKNSFENIKINHNYTLVKIIDIDDQNKYGVYIILNTYNNKYYIGSTINLNARIINHVKELRENKHHSIHLQRSWNKYGGEYFIFGVLEYVENTDNLIEREQYWLDELKAYNDKYGYNICKKAYSCLGVKHGERPQEVKDKISKANKGRVREDVWGSKNSSSKLTEETVEEIKLRIHNGEFVQEVSKDYDVSSSIIYDIINRTTWKHVLPNLDLSNCKNLTPHAKLNEKEVLEIREKLLNGVNIKDLSKEYCISIETIRDIKSYRTWKSIKPLEEVI